MASLYSNIMSARPYKDSGLLLNTHKATDKVRQSI